MTAGRHALTARPPAIPTGLWLVAAVLAVLSVWLLNGRPLFYYDTAGYVKQGQVALTQLHLLSPAPSAGAAPASGAAAGAANPTVDGSRSPSYSLLAGVFSALGALEGLLLLDLAALVVGVALLVRPLARSFLPGQGAARLAAQALVLAALGSLPFYAAFLMPDLLTPALLLTFAALGIFGGRMTRGELILAYLTGTFAVIAHLSHLPIALLTAAAALPLALATRRRGFWRGPLVLALILATAFAQQAAFRLLAAKAAHAEVTILPFLTARLIQDGPGQRWLAARCPDASVPTCRLWAELSKSDDPYRLTASHIIFETTERLGSFQHLSPEDRAAVSRDQAAFARAVVTADPLGVAAAFLRNVGQQAARLSVVMTLPFDKVVAANATVTGALGGPLAVGRLGEPAPWVDALSRGQGGLYAGALGFLLALLLLPGALPRDGRLVVLLILAGILANAAVCGGLSQPSDRYGARVIWLLPFTAVLAGALARREAAP